MHRYHKLSEETAHVMLERGTEPSGSGEYFEHDDEGVYICRQCDLPLFLSDDKFTCGCGWPSFDDTLGCEERPDGDRVEVVCPRCTGHLGHVFDGEGLTQKNRRYCINSLSLDFENGKGIAIVAGGCFWGVEHLLKDLPGVLDVVSGYSGGEVADPTYEEVCGGNTGHAEAVQVVFDPEKISYEDVLKAFFEIHDPTQKDGQGPDLGSQYRSAVFYLRKEQKEVAEKLINQLKGKGFDVVTEVVPASKFYPAEDYHQDYYVKNNKQPYCHYRSKIFSE